MRRADDLTSLGTLLREGLFAIPEYQRDYSWTPKSCQTLTDDIFYSAQHGTKHYMGSIVVMKLDDTFKAQSAQGDPTKVEGARELFHVVDGQQRLTSCSLFLCAIRDCMAEEDPSDFDQSGIKTYGRLRTKIERHLFDEDTVYQDNYAPRLFLNNDTSLQYEACLKHSESKARGWKLNNAYKQFKLAIHDRKPSHEKLSEYYFKLLNTVLDGLTVDDVCCDSFGSAFQIFESINAKGQPLAPVDLIKCYLMQKAQTNISDARTRWNKLLDTVKSNPDNSANLDKFMSAFLFTEMGERVSKAKSYEKFRDHFAGHQYSYIFEQLQNAAEMYNAITQESASETDPFYAFKVLKLTQVYVPLLAAARFTENGLQSDLYINLKRRLLPFAVRYQICGGSSNALDGRFIEMIKLIRAGKSAEEVYSPLRNLTPSNEWFREAFGELTFKDSEESLARYLLAQIESYLERVEKHSEKMPPENFSLEHIIPKEYSTYIENCTWKNELPDSFERDYIRSIGNLVLIKQNDNSAALNSPYETKIAIYQEGAKNSDLSPTAGYNLLDKLVNQYPEDFGPSEVKQRALQLAEYASATWPL